MMNVSQVEKFLFLRALLYFLKNLKLWKKKPENLNGSYDKVSHALKVRGFLKLNIIK